MKSRIGNGDRIAMLMEAGLAVMTLLMLAFPPKSDLFDLILDYMRTGACS